ncbi:hypothetical protein KCU85_g360, partial [Aureobasidium melanogenum]
MFTKEAGASRFIARSFFNLTPFVSTMVILRPFAPLTIESEPRFFRTRAGSSPAGVVPFCILSSFDHQLLFSACVGNKTGKIGQVQHCYSSRVRIGQITIAIRTIVFRYFELRHDDNTRIAIHVIVAGLMMTRRNCTALRRSISKYGKSYRYSIPFHILAIVAADVAVAVGGASATWTSTEGTKSQRVASQIMPSHKVPAISGDRLGSSPVLSNRRPRRRAENATAASVQPTTLESNSELGFPSDRNGGTGLWSHYSMEKERFGSGEQNKALHTYEIDDMIRGLYMFCASNLSYATNENFDGRLEVPEWSIEIKRSDVLAVHSALGSYAAQFSSNIPNTSVASTFGSRMVMHK